MDNMTTRENGPEWFSAAMLRHAAAGDWAAFLKLQETEPALADAVAFLDNERRARLVAELPPVLLDRLPSLRAWGEAARETHEQIASERRADGLPTWDPTPGSPEELRRLVSSPPPPRRPDTDPHAALRARMTAAAARPPRSPTSPRPDDDEPGPARRLRM